MARIGLLTLVATALLAAGCGGSGDGRARASGQHAKSVSAGRPDAAKVRVIRGWADALRAGHVKAAARYFSVPAIVQNLSPLIKLTTAAQVRAFNAALPCGARLKKAVASGAYVKATFVLTDRPGGRCGRGAGREAGTAFRIRAGKIVEWRRVRLPSEQPPPPSPQPREPLRQAS